MCESNPEDKFRPYWRIWNPADKGYDIIYGPCAGCGTLPPSFTDDVGACFGNGFLCMVCGYYRIGDYTT